ncbi:MAG: D-alanine--D-alanine ligase family protein [Erysipelotrichaceae bacterium]
MNKTKLAIIFGGKSTEYPVSLHSAGSLIRNVDLDRFEMIFVGIDAAGNWYYYPGDIESIEHDTWLNHPGCVEMILSPSPKDKGFVKLYPDGHYEKLEIDCIFPVLHGKNGEDGTIQGIFEMSGIPYVGCGTMSSSISMDKEITHIVCERAGIAMAPFICMKKAKQIDYHKAYLEAKTKLGLPIFVKPACAGSSFGISMANNEEEFIQSVQMAFEHDRKVILETTIKGFEIGCAISGNEDLTIGSCDEIQTSAAFFDYEGKYELVNSQIYCPARISEKLMKEAKALARNAYVALDCMGMTRVDMFVVEDHVILNEVNTIPGFTATSRYPSMMKDIGVSFKDLINHLVDLAFQK